MKLPKDSKNNKMRFYMDRYIKRIKKEHVIMQLNKAVESVTVDA